MAEKTVTFTAFFPKNEGAKFDINYYTNIHMPEVAAAWKKHGLQGYMLSEAIELPSIPLVPYSVMCVATFEAQGENGLDGVVAALESEEGKRLQEDVVNFINTKPIGFVGNVVTNTFIVSQLPSRIA